MKTLLLYMILGQAADGGTTLLAFHRGCVEAGPSRMLPQASIVPLKASVTVTLVWGLPRQHAAHPTATKAVALTFGTAGAAAAIWNATQLSHCHTR